MVSIVAGYFLLKETHPDMQPRIALPVVVSASEHTSLIAPSDVTKSPATATYGSITTTITTIVPKISPPSIYTKQVIAIIVALGIFTYHSMTYDHLFPIFLEDDRGVPSIRSADFPTQPFNPFVSPGGLGLSVRQVGGIMSCDGIFATFIQLVIYPWLTGIFGIHRLFIIVTLFHPLAYVLMPFLVYLPSAWLFPGIYACVVIRNLTAIIAFPLLFLLLEEASPAPTVLGKINGLAASSGAACRTVAPLMAGYLYTLGSRMEFTGLAWYGSTFVALIGAIQCFQVRRAKAELSPEDKGDELSPLDDDEGQSRYSYFNKYVDAASDSKYIGASG